MKEFCQVQCIYGQKALSQIYRQALFHVSTQVRHHVRNRFLDQIDDQVRDQMKEIVNENI